MMNLLALLGVLVVVSAQDDVWPCDRAKAIRQFKLKSQTNKWPSFGGNDPYNNQTKESEKEIAETLKNNDIVCAIRYVDDTKVGYELRQFESKQAAESAGFIVTHQGKCGACSNLRDLAVYLEKNLTAPVRKCAFKAVISKRWARNCILAIGFTETCTDIWLYNSINTRKECFGICMKDWITGKPNNNPDGSLNDCLQCDEDKSGPVFKYFSGRTRRNSGINSAIKRPGQQVYKMNHCYF
ncbi:uncharacterized protein LOC135688811 [Rhopilema esculentum]|uniref:uncharacterized protein LOC135688811 n=1 Tax=Rhopilema esculentum TaxID=499914 RepID=UPI0031D74B6F|eukprot:gene7478-13252_t